MSEAIEQHAEAALAEVTGIKGYVAGVEINSPELAQWAAELGQLAAGKIKALEKERDSGAKPAYALYKKIRGWFKPAIDGWTAVKNDAKAGVLSFQAIEAAKAAAALSEATSQEEITQAVAAIAPAPAGFTSIDRWSGKVVDESKLPRRFWIIDQAAIDREIQASKGEAAIDGVEVVHAKTARIRG